MKVENQKSNNIDIWPYLLEKAYAKYYSTYDALHGGEFNCSTELDFLQELTGCPI